MGEVVVRIEPDDTVRVPTAILAQRLASRLAAETVDRIGKVRSLDGHATTAELTAAGLDVAFDKGAMELRLEAPAAQRAVTDLDLGPRRHAATGTALAQPAIVSGYLNVLAGVDHRWGDVSGARDTSGRLDLFGVTRLWNVVIEHDASYDGDVDAFWCPAGALCDYRHSAGLKRQRSRLVYDIPERELRIQAGDAEVLATGVQRAPDVLGLAIEKSPRKLRPGDGVRPVGRSSFRLDRAAEVEIVVNGAVVNRLRLRAGVYNLADLPLVTGANHVKLRIIEETGELRELDFTRFYDSSLLAEGASEWALAGGVPSHLRDSERHYVTGEAFASGFYRYGISDRVTGEANLQADSLVVMGGLGVFGITPWGVLGLQGAASESELGPGYAVNATWSAVNFRGFVSHYSGASESLHLAAEYRSSEFRAPGEILETASGILYPRYNYWLRLSASYTTPIWAGVTATWSGRYQFADEDAVILSPYTLKGDRFGVDLTLSSALTPTLSGSVTAGYSNESYYFYDTRRDDQAELRAMVRLYWRPDEATRIATGFDTLTQEAQVTAQRSVGGGIDRWETTVGLQSHGRTGHVSGTAGLSHTGNRADVRVFHSGGLEDLGFASRDARWQDQRTSARIGTSIAFVDGTIAAGPPIRGHGYAVLVPHESIRGKTVIAGTQEDIRARADGLGPGIVPDLPAYAPVSIPLDANDLPLGYSMGTGSFEAVAPYRGGYRIEVGSAYSVSAFGTLVKADGTPLPLTAGSAWPVERPEKRVTVFTNRSGRFAADGLAPGIWRIEMETDGAPTLYEIEVPAGTEGLFKAGTLKPLGGGR